MTLVLELSIRLYLFNILIFSLFLLLFGMVKSFGWCVNRAERYLYGGENSSATISAREVLGGFYTRFNAFKVLEKK